MTAKKVSWRWSNQIGIYLTLRIFYFKSSYINENDQNLPFLARERIFGRPAPIFLASMVLYQILSQFFTAPLSKLKIELKLVSFVKIKLETPFNLSSTVSPICLPESTDFLLSEGTRCVTTGWGIINKRANLMQQITEVRPIRDCEALYQKGTGSRLGI